MDIQFSSKLILLHFIISHHTIIVHIHLQHHYVALVLVLHILVVIGLFLSCQAGCGWSIHISIEIHGSESIDINDNIVR
jgi:hypothetical protein